MGVYCSECGEKRRDHADWKLSSIAREAFEELTSLENSKLWQTFRLLLFKPGQLTRDYWNGRRKRYLGPVKLYLIFFALSLVLYSIHQPSAVYDVRTLAKNDARGSIMKGLNEMAEKRGVPTEQVVQEINSRWQSYISFSQIAYPLFVALILKLVLRRRGLYLAEHLIFSLHVLAFMLASSALLWPLFALFGIQMSVHRYLPVVLLTAASTVWGVAYLVLALRRAYSERWGAAIFKSAIVFVTYLVGSSIFMFVLLKTAVQITQRAG
jgi:hypothetical protein